MNPTQQSSGGFRIPEFGKKSGLTAIRSKDANILVRCLNALGAMTVAKGNTNAFNYAEGNVQLTLKNISEGGAAGALTVTETDSAPSVSDVTEIRFPDGTVTDLGSGIVEVATATGALTVEEMDGSPSVPTVTKIKFSNGTVASGGTGIAEVTIAAASAVQMYRYKSQAGDYIVCRTWDGTTEGGSDVNIAKPMKLRNSIASALIGGVTVTYTYPSEVERIATISGVDEDQVIVPRYLVNDLILAIDSTGGTAISGTLQSKIDLNVDGRAWAKKNT